MVVTEKDVYEYSFINLLLNDWLDAVLWSQVKKVGPPPRGGGGPHFGITF
jgi:hypothetical protein